MAYVGTGVLMDDAERCQRLIEAVLSNIDNWSAAVAEIEAVATPGNKIRSLHLLKSLEQAKRSLLKLAGLPDE